MINLDKKIIDRFWSNVHVDNQNSCWKYQGSLRRGYGRICINRKIQASHRVSWVIHNGPIPSNKLVLHICDNRRCVNPRHLYLGNYIDNMTDRQDRNSITIKGRPSNTAINIVLEMKKLYNTGKYTYTDLSHKFKIPRTTIWRSIKNISMGIV